MYTIYRVRNAVTRKSYIGFTTRNPESRWKEHLREARYGSQRHLHKSIRKHQERVWVLDVLCWGEDELVGKNVSEPLMIELFNPEYNETKGGEGILGYRHKDTIKKQQSMRMMRNAHTTGRIRPIEEKQAIHLASVGIPKPKVTCPHCLLTGGNPVMKRYHFDRCKRNLVCHR